MFWLNDEILNTSQLNWNSDGCAMCIRYILCINIPFGKEFCVLQTWRRLLRNSDVVSILEVFYKNLFWMCLCAWVSQCEFLPVVVVDFSGENKKNRMIFAVLPLYTIAIQLLFVLLRRKKNILWWWWRC